MSNGKITLTRKIQLLVDTTDKAFMKECYDKLYAWQHFTFRAANYIFTHHYIQEQIKELFYLNEDTQVKLADIKKDADGILTSSRLHTTYQVLSGKFKGQMPIKIISTLNHTLVSYFNKEKAAYIRGEKSVRNYKREIPIPFGPDSLLPITEDEKCFRFKLFNIPFKTYLGKDYNDKKLLLRRVIAGTVRLRTSAIQLKQNKLFLLAALEMDKEAHELKQEVIAEARLSFEYPVSVKIGSHSYHIGTRDEFLHRRLAIQSARQRAQSAAAGNRGGHGRKRKLKNVHHYDEAEKNFINYKMHVYSRRLIDLCVKHQAANLLLCKAEEDDAAAQEDRFLFRNWSVGNLYTKIRYKADKAGINLVVE